MVFAARPAFGIRRRRELRPHAAPRRPRQLCCRGVTRWRDPRVPLQRRGVGARRRRRTGPARKALRSRRRLRAVDCIPRTPPGRRSPGLGFRWCVHLQDAPVHPLDPHRPWGELFIVAPTHNYEIRAYDPAGALTLVVRREHALVAPTPAFQEAEIERRVALRPPEEQAERRRELRERFAETPMPETFPAFSAIMADALGHLWVQERPSRPRAA